MWIWAPLWIANGLLAVMIGMFGAGLRPDQPPKPFAGTPWMGTDILAALVAVTCVCIALHIIFYERAMRKPGSKGERS